MRATKQCYRYDENTFEYKGTSTSYEDPMNEGRFPTPANCTFTAPPEYGENQIPVYSKDSDSWTVMADHRKHLNEQGNYEGGTAYWLPTDNYLQEARYMTEIGDLPEGALLEKPEKPESVIRKEELESQIADLKQFLEDTDYVTLKILEEPETKDSYAEILAKRKTARASVDPLQAELDELIASME